MEVNAAYQTLVDKMWLGTPMGLPQSSGSIDLVKFGLLPMKSVDHDASGNFGLRTDTVKSIDTFPVGTYAFTFEKMAPLSVLEGIQELIRRTDEKGSASDWVAI